MNEQIDSSTGIQAALLKVFIVIVITTTLLALSDGISSFLSTGTLGLLTGPFTFIWWPYFRHEMGLQPLAGIIPIALIFTGVWFRAKKGAWLISYAGSIMWVIVGFFYVITHIL